MSDLSALIVHGAAGRKKHVAPSLDPAFALTVDDIGEARIALAAGRQQRFHRAR